MEGTDVAGFIAAAAGAAFLTNLIVGGIKRALPNLSSAVIVGLAFVSAEAGQFLLLVSQDAQFTRSSIAAATIIGLVAWGLAIGQVEVQRKADRVDEKIDKAIAMPSDTTKAEVEAAVKRDAS